MPGQESHAEAALLEALPEEISDTADTNPFYDKALDDYLERILSGKSTGEEIEEAAARFKSGDLSANELVRSAIGIPILVGHYYVQRGELEKQEVLEVAPRLVVEIAEEPGAGNYTGRLADAAEAYWKDGVAGDEAATVVPMPESTTPEKETAEERNRRERTLALRAQDGDERAFEQLCERYRLYAYHLSRDYFIQGGERQDLMQEAMFGLMKAVPNYRPDRGSFRSIAEIAMYRQVITAVKTSTRHKHEPLNNAVPFDRPNPTAESEDGTLYDVLPNRAVVEPWATLSFREEIAACRGTVQQEFTDLERAVWSGYQAGLKYEEIGELLGTSQKQVDNALQRAKRKISRTFAKAA